MATPDYATWLTKQAAADAIGVSTKTVEAFAKDRKIDQAAHRPQGRGAVRVVYNPDDVARIAAERQPARAPFVLGAVKAAGHGNGNGGLSVEPSPHWRTPGVVPAGEDPIRQLFAAALRAVLSSPTSESSEKSGPAYVARAEARAIAGVSDEELRKAVAAGEVKMRGRRYRRKDLEAL